MLKIDIRTIPDSEQRYNTVADYHAEGDREVISVSDMGDWRHEMLTAIHELVELSLCKHRGIGDDAIDAYDFKFNKERAEGDVGEPGDRKDAPYHKEHAFASFIEKELARELNVNWDAYSEASDRLNLR
jgi:hypothetical protein